MSLLDHGSTVTALVYVEEPSTDAYDNTVLVPSDTPISVGGRLQPAGATLGSERTEDGQVTDTRYRFISRTFPGGPYARVEVDGRSWDVVGDPKHHAGSAMTDHYTTLLRERGALAESSSSSSSSSS